MLYCRDINFKNWVITLFFSLHFVVGHAQNKCEIYGIIQDTNGDPIPYASIYIPELSSGSMANIDGSFQINLPCQSHEIIIQSMGYKTQKLTIDLSKNRSDYNIILKTQPISIDQVTVNTSSEDPAYNMIRKAIVMAQYYKKQVKTYDCNVYVRSFYDVDNIPFLAEKLMNEEDLRDVKVGNVYETYMHYSYEYPNKVKEKILHVKTGDRDTSKNGSSYINLSFYNIGGSSIISPLSKSSFSVYEFEYISSYSENEKLIHKIKVIPKRAGNDLMKGMIYLNDETWNINSVDVKFKQQLVNIHYKQIYSEIEPNAWLPINHDIKVETNLLGFKVHFQYMASLSDISLTTDSVIDLKIQQALKQNKADIAKIKEELIQAKANRKLSKTEEKINELIEKENLNKKETLKLVRLIKKQENAEQYKNDDDFEISKNHQTEYDDSAFVTKDSIWNLIRQIPLSTEESEIYVSRDSLNLIIDGDTIINKERRLIANLFVFNGFVKTPNKNERLQIPGLFRQLRLNFNTVDGITIDKTLFNYRRNYKGGRYYSIEPRIEFLLARKGTNKELSFTSLYNTKSRAGFNIDFGKVSEDFNREHAIEPIINTVSSLLFEENYKKIFQKEYLKIEHHFDIKNGLALSSSLELENRTQKQNNSSFKILNRKSKSYTSNIPNHSDIVLAPIQVANHQATSIAASLSYTPKYFYRIKDGRKEMLYSNYPTYSLNYEQGIKDIFGGDSEFYLLEFSIHQAREYKLLDQVSYYAGIGKFIGTKPNYFADYKAFTTTPFFISGQKQAYSFRLLDYYQFNARDYYLEGHFSVEDNALLLKRLPLFSETNLTEELHFNYLYTEQELHFYEFGYSLNRILLLLNLEVFVSFVDHKHDATGFRMSLKF